MRNYLLLPLLLFLIIGCKKEPKVVIKDDNRTTITVIERNETVPSPPPPPPPKVEEELIPEENMFTWNVNDEMITEREASKIVVIKSQRVLVLLDEEGNLLSRHRISLGKNNIGTKLQQGDYKTPEGTYSIIDKRNDKVYYKELLISYPNQEDKERSKSLGFSTGGGITIHAQPNWNWDGHGNDFTLSNDWTEGCMAVTNEGMDTLWKMVSLGTPVEIRE